MIKLVNFLLFLENTINYDKRDIDEGRTPPLIYKICSCLREAFCLSYAIRKNNNVYFYFQRDHVLIKFDGKELRYLGPDERSQALLLEKALKKQTTSNLDKWSPSLNAGFFKVSPLIILKSSTPCKNKLILAIEEVVRFFSWP